ncbi:hypothetical protein F8O06_00710 [Pseudoclavibacter sp. CFCC 14310]|uniref:hypothetical protein n=1 Tax=Pseudoclavibacter sp. CFCC 14310 TaxID=2615180 RepID=UPI00130151AF|nr:hypothetical protein [Pseudoclavibacter sp. CFCC 14310]KAB1647136.1 hypothetical protein F8O06_00710 [Pseudoclavibacter sp. CFCC 14310]
MTDRRDPQKKLLQDVIRFKAQRNEARRTLAGQAVLVRELRAQLLAVRLAGRLLRTDDFQRFVGVDNVLDEHGRIDWVKVDNRVDDLLRRRPELAAKPDRIDQGEALWRQGPHACSQHLPGGEHEVEAVPARDLSSMSSEIS